MSWTDTPGRLSYRDAGFALLCLLAVGTVPVAQFTWLVILDSTGLDAAVPGLLGWVALPALTTSLVVGVVGRRLYSPRRGVRYAAVVFLAGAATAVGFSTVFVVGGPPPG